MTVEQQCYGAQTTTDEVVAGIDLSGKTAVITGASGGLGAEVARALASRGATVVLASRDLQRTQRKAEEIAEQTGNHQLQAVAIDLADLDSVRAAATAIRSSHPVIDILVNNAGVMACEFGLTKQGFESQFGVNHVGHFVFTLGLIESLQAATAARVVVLSSGGHKYGDVDLTDPNFQQREYNKWAAYGAAKSANAQFAVGLNQRYGSAGITANAVHPGVIITDLGRHLTEDDIAFLMGENSSASSANDVSAENDSSDNVGTPQGGRGAASMFKSVEQGAATTVWAATSPMLTGCGGLYLENCQVAAQVDVGVQSHGYYPHALDSTAADALWQLTEQLVASC
ncbi:NAD(P)-dependent dehydrogenase (short-subunit alcohol dehydrogenase family) [Sinobacterium caligoides]|uniref:NAD(P)-dependent dehydrogenase (Short-subunit alcohol dehydrogenase family) n=1 Tax=Sinobacterium caligoides TaxID=933926 RepID=A0A3N2DP92_9GAMM|nr:SDR family NAD(P)-dependent oxidoreductase [Sinobacterium caligoides]ROS01145.1 NAD(P)-dependent dehydrogenase (short-subunit alcohol dehydrogenase family) [Sinobacterium caligoides]